jgi:hypothetical protein
MKNCTLRATQYKRINVVNVLQFVDYRHSSFQDRLSFQSRKWVKQDRQCTHKRNIEARSRTHRSREKVRNIKYSDCVFVAFVIQHAKRTRRIIFASVTCLYLPYFTSFHERQDFPGRGGGGELLHIKYLLIFSRNLSETFPILKEFSDILW